MTTKFPLKLTNTSLLDVVEYFLLPIETRVTITKYEELLTDADYSRLISDQTMMESLRDVLLKDIEIRRAQYDLGGHLFGTSFFLGTRSTKALVAKIAQLKVERDDLNREYEMYRKLCFMGNGGTVFILEFN